MSRPPLTPVQNAAVFALTAVVLLVVLAWWNARGTPAPVQLGEDATCEARCMARDPECEALAEPQGGFPGPELASAERRARCRGLCVVLRASAPDAGNACLK